MEKKPVMPFAALLVIAAGWLFFTHGGHQNPITLDDFRSGSGSRTETKVTVRVEADPADNEARVTRLAELFKQEDSPWHRHAEVHDIHCEDLTCTVEASPKSDPGQLCSHMENLVREHPWLGTRVDIHASARSKESLTFLFRREAAPSPPP